MKVLQIIDGEDKSGIVKIITDLTSNIKDVEFDFLTSVNIIDEWNNLGVSRKTLIGKIKYNHRLKKYLKKNKYDVVHINSGVFLYSFQVAYIAKRAKVKKVISHSHSIPKYSFLKRLLKKILSPIYRKKIDVKLACSEEAAISLFGNTKDVIYINNGIDINKYKFNEKLRDKYRKKLNIDKKTVYGHVGLFVNSKNHYYLIELFNEIIKKEDAVLILIGKGPLEDSIKEKVKELNIEDKVIFMGYISNVYEVLNAFDYFLFPSITEGLGLAVIEAQTNGITTYCSENIPEIANISKCFNRFNLNDSKKELVNRIISNKPDVKKRKDAYKCAIDSGYDIKDVAKRLKDIYK